MSDSISWKDPFIRAGVNQPSYIAESEGLYCACFFRFRPASSTEIEVQNSKVTGNADKEALVKSIDAFVLKHLASWSFEAPITLESIASLRHPLKLQIYWRIMQTEKTDPIPAEYLKDGEDTSGAMEQLKK